MDALNARIGSSSLLTDGAKPMVTLDTGSPVVTSYQEKTEERGHYRLPATV